ncbi:hypothetical protein BJP34_19785 [Moorena producens PAL-8-15-08-1]|uniref:Uncharacterized protein n=1 Tax=Moorena producens PAL-8-15-08-1 TaxID=1458985 RepID=A0A1D8TUP4_9CYAN|nr:hypothetical protein BJP34_19785 [Moorena producens PAL-8-15-08-1]
MAIGQGSRAVLSLLQRYRLDSFLVSIVSVVERGFNPRNDISLESLGFQTRENSIRAPNQLLSKTVINPFKLVEGVYFNLSEVISIPLPLN